ncbi:MCP four helix bundle domain-containing protein [Hymenobacter sp. B81]|uniref:MCP four helix bundle domain-containing protein n=1 Tax=Hymenobacter sp. B81 TaxID=3344878 RepID=UPI0037DDB290
MNPLSRIHHKAKPAFLFLTVLALVLLGSVVEKRLMHDMKTSVSSLYQDRLLPATGLFRLNDLMHAKRRLVEEYLARPSAARLHATQIAVAGRNVQIDSLISRYEATYLVAEEQRIFGRFRADLRRYNDLEHALLTAGAPAAGPRQLSREFDAIHGELVRLSDIQLSVGEELSAGSAAIEGNAVTVSNLQIGIMLVLTLAIQRALLLDTHPLIPKSLKNFRLN